ncbi:MAG TPA: hypothetical protein VFG59_17300 [Anaeromyxobacter sp.]|nr:hypothetical protein [Anaeromyxobacter sp.]
MPARRAFAALPALLLTLAGPAAARPTLSRVLARTFRFYGGVDALLGVGALRVQGRLTDVSSAPGNAPRLERLVQPPERFLEAVSLGGIEREAVVLDGGRAFRDGAEVTGLARADQIRLEAARSFLPAALARERSALLDRGEAERGGRRVRLVEFPLHDGAALTAEIDPGSGRILAAVTRVAGRETRVSFRRLRPVSGILFPFEEEAVAREGRTKLLVEDVEVLPAEAVRIEHP